MLNMSNVFRTSLHEFINKFSNNGIAKFPNKNISALTQQMNTLCERLDKSRALTRHTLLHVLTGLTWCSVSDFVSPFELMFNNERVR